MQPNSEIRQIKVEELPAAERHEILFETFDQLEVGDSFEIIVGHNPRPLYTQFKVRYPEAFTWEYRESGPTAWVAQVTKISQRRSASESAGGCCGMCGSE